MKHKIWSQHLICTLIAGILAVSAIGNLVTGYDLPIKSLWNILLWSAIFAFATSMIFRLRYGGWILLCIASVAGLFLWKIETIWQQIQQQAESLCYIISYHYHDVYNWPVWGSPAANDVSLPLLFWTALVTTSVNWYICRRKHIVIAIVPTVLPLVLCLLTTDRVPDAVYLYLMILGLAILFISDWTRRKHPAQGMKLVLQSALPIAVALALLFALNPREEYVNNAGKFQKEVVAWVQEFQNTAESVASGTPVTSAVNEKLDLRTVGPKSKISHSVMRVNSTIGGTQYLRGRDYDEYTGTGWEASSERNEEFTSGGSFAGELTIVTYGVRNILYVPYYTTKEIHLMGGALENEENLQRYSYYLSRPGRGNTDAPSSRYTKLPDYTLQWAEEAVKEITDGTTSESEKIALIQNFVRSSADYDLSTSRMNSEYSDFAQWFLEESKTGYCVHFATAATVLLRAAGIPARYVEGYMVSCNADSYVVVTNQDAHAWTEYFDSDSGAWRILESTPAGHEDEETGPAVTMPETETRPEETRTQAGESGLEPSDAEDIPTKSHTGKEEVPGKSEDLPENALGPKEEKVIFSIPKWIKTVFKCLLFTAFIPLQGYVRICWKQTQWNRGRANERTMTRWRQTRSLAKLLKQTYPEELDGLAQKAKFSQHKIQTEELKLFDDYRNMLYEQMRKKPWHYRIVLKWLFAIDI